MYVLYLMGGYGYYTGKIINGDDVAYPTCDDDIKKAKQYKSMSGAARAGNMIVERCWYVKGYQINKII